MLCAHHRGLRGWDPWRSVLTLSDAIESRMTGSNHNFEQHRPPRSFVAFVETGRWVRARASGSDQNTATISIRMEIPGIAFAASMSESVGSALAVLGRKKTKLARIKECYGSFIREPKPPRDCLRSGNKCVPPTKRIGFKEAGGAAVAIQFSLKAAALREVSSCAETWAGYSVSGALGMSSRP